MKWNQWNLISTYYETGCFPSYSFVGFGVKKTQASLQSKETEALRKQIVTLIFGSCLAQTSFCQNESFSFSFYSHFLDDKGKLRKWNFPKCLWDKYSHKGAWQQKGVESCLVDVACCSLSSVWPMQVSALITSTHSENILNRLLRKVANLFLWWCLRIPFLLSVATHHYQPPVEERVEFRMQLEEVVWIIDT